MLSLKRFGFKHTGCLLIALFLCLAPLGCESVDVRRYPSWPNERTQKAAKEIQLSQASAIHIDTGNKTVVTNPKIIKQLLLGLRNATEVGIRNQVCYVEVAGVGGNILLSDSFALDGPQHALSPEFIVGLRQAGVRLDWEEKARRRQQRLRAVSTLGGVLLLCLLSLWLAARFRAPKRSA